MNPLRLLRAATAWWAARPLPLRWAPVFAGIGVIWWSSSQPGSAFGVQLGSFVHNGGHIVAFGGLAALLLPALAPPGEWRRRHAVQAIAISGFYGAIDELHQNGVAGRVCSLADVISDIVGATFACVLLFAFVLHHPRARRAVVPMSVLAVVSVAFATWGPW